MNEHENIEETPHDRFVFTMAWWASTFAFYDMLQDDPAKAAELLEAVSLIDEGERSAFMFAMASDAVKNGRVK